MCLTPLIDINLTEMFHEFKKYSKFLKIEPQEFWTKRIEYILEGNLLKTSVKRPFCCTVSILQVYFTYLCYITFWAQEYHLIEDLKLIKRTKL